MDKKRIKITILLVCSVLVLFLLTSLSYGNKRLADITVTEDELISILESREDKTFQTISLKLEGNACFKEEESDFFYYSVIDGAKEPLNPTLKVVGDERGLKAAVTKTLSWEDIEKNEPLEVVIYNDKYFHIYKLTVTTLPIMNIECKHDMSEEDSKMHMTLFDNRKNTASRVVASDGFVRYRGATTLYYPKKGMRLSLTMKSVGENRRPNDISLLGLRQDDDWILYAAYNDQEKIRNVFSHNLWEYSCARDNAENIDAGMEYKYIELFVNGRYEGLYALGSPLDEKQFELSGKADEEALYKSISWSSPENVIMTEAGVDGFEVKSGTDMSAWDLYIQYCDYLVKNKSDSQALMKGIDLDNAIDFSLFMALIQGMDTTNGPKAKNFYISIKDKNGQLQGLYAPWDMDISWGNYWIGDININFTIPYGNSANDFFLFEQGYLNRIIVNNDTEIGKLYVDKYKKLRSSVWSDESIEALLLKYEAQIYGSGAYRRDMARWPEGTYNDPEEKLTKFIKYAKKRFSRLDEYIERLDKNFAESVLARRSTQFRNFDSAKFFIKINDPMYLTDPAFVALYKYMGVDMDLVMSKCTFDENGVMTDYPAALIFNAKKKKTQTIQKLPKSFGETEAFKTEESGDGFSFDGTKYVFDSVIGSITLERREGSIYFTEDDYGVFIDDVVIYSTLAEYEPPVHFCFVDKEKAHTMDLTID